MGFLANFLATVVRADVLQPMGTARSGDSSGADDLSVRQETPDGAGCHFRNAGELHRAALYDAHRGDVGQHFLVRRHLYDPIFHRPLDGASQDVTPEPTSPNARSSGSFPSLRLCLGYAQRNPSLQSSLRKVIDFVI